MSLVGFGLPDGVLLLESAISLTLAVAFACGPIGCTHFGAGQPKLANAFTAAHMSPAALGFFTPNFAGVTCSATLLVAVYYRGYRQAADGGGKPRTHCAAWLAALLILLLTLV